MKNATSSPQAVDDYIAGFPADVQTILKTLRATIRKAAPTAEESISYKIPAFKLNGPLIYFAAWKSHVAVYPRPRGDTKLDAELKAYGGGKGTIKFPIDRPIPYNLVARIVKRRMQENAARAAKGKKR
ncbi:MAG: DUF1801 domain-containing protein [Planctomycetota bacterium]|nr:DUF1801 domain-containing protein [Planctomycetota bacterium]MDA1214318.1 DUF1801 domain-containing protein [Planctomycetota bacterium]